MQSLFYLFLTINSFQKNSTIRKRCTCSLLLIVLALTLQSLNPKANGQTTEKKIPVIATPSLPKEKETTVGLYLTSKEAYEKWKASPENNKIIDVRTTEEYLFVGHAAMAWNITAFLQSYQWDSEKKKFPMTVNPDFVKQVMMVAKPNDTLLLMCRSGGRSALAVNQLAAAGFKNVFNITDGFEGDTVNDPNSMFNGQHMVNGWKNAGLPWTYQPDPAKMVLPKL